MEHMLHLQSDLSFANSFDTKILKINREVDYSPAWEMQYILCRRECLNAAVSELFSLSVANGPAVKIIMRD